MDSVVEDRFKIYVGIILKIQNISEGFDNLLLQIFDRW